MTGRVGLFVVKLMTCSLIVGGLVCINTLNMTGWGVALFTSGGLMMVLYGYLSVKAVQRNGVRPDRTSSSLRSLLPY